jgi:hypothetical protein
VGLAIIRDPRSAWTVTWTRHYRQPVPASSINPWNRCPSGDDPFHPADSIDNSRCRVQPRSVRLGERDKGPETGHRPGTRPGDRAARHKGQHGAAGNPQHPPTHPPRRNDERSAPLGRHGPRAGRGQTGAHVRPRGDVGGRDVVDLARSTREVQDDCSATLEA